MNNQLPEHPSSDAFRLEVHSIFNTIQGEGPFAGRQAIFVRLAGCNLQCPLCDTDYTSRRDEMTATEILARVSALCNNRRPMLVVITGGEPFRQDLHTLFCVLAEAGYTVQVETNGTLPPPSEGPFHYACIDEVYLDLLGQPGARVFLVCSPKTGSVNPRIRANACAFKYVIRDGELLPDGLPCRALNHTARPHLARPHVPSTRAPAVVYVQPCDEKDACKNRANLEATKRVAMDNAYILQQQLHKQIEVE